MKLVESSEYEVDAEADPTLVDIQISFGCSVDEMVFFQRVLGESVIRTPSLYHMSVVLDERGGLVAVNLTGGNPREVEVTTSIPPFSGYKRIKLEPSDLTARTEDRYAFHGGHLAIMLSRNEVVFHRIHPLICVLSEGAKFAGIVAIDFRSWCKV